MSGICYIIGAGEFYGEISIEDTDMLIAADGGYDHALKHGLVPDVLIGDFDSIESIPKNIKTIKYPKEKDETDMFLAYKTGVENGYDKFFIYGGTGGREDHTFANYSLLSYAKNENNSVFLIGENSKIYIIKDEKISLFGKGGKCVSIFAFGADAFGVTIKGLKYEAENITISHSFPLGVSNSFTDTSEAFISVEHGSLLIFEEK